MPLYDSHDNITLSNAFMYLTLHVSTKTLDINMEMLYTNNN